ncbi:hypothetical protein GIB67_035725 [Kingdonia uniflora]|uniref:Uncharacterized protein n=1 Tax=Kingdonia uniflora TaxID=39325 RepID=A0A7J7M5H0_9MAGN|nr:hypothetical protein GIB67_035725 [Kingdonia uniflora]
MVTTDSYVWDEYLKEHLKVKPMRTKIIRNYHNFDKIYGKSTIIGKYARSTKDQKSGKLSNVNITHVQDSSDDAAVDDDSTPINNEVGKTTKRKNVNCQRQLQLLKIVKREKEYW